jgi:hypothetical protein
MHMKLHPSGWKRNVSPTQSRPNVGSQRDGEIYEPLAVLTKARRVSVRSHHGFVPDCLRWVGGLGSALGVSDLRESIGRRRAHILPTLAHRST